MPSVNITKPCSSGLYSIPTSQEKLDDYDMIAASEPKVFVPCGRERLRNHPGSVILPSTKPQLQPESHLLHLLSQVNISDNSDAERWVLRESPDYPQCEEELYVRGKTVVWSRGEGTDPGQPGPSDANGSRNIVICSYTGETKVSHALWTTFQTAASDRPSTDRTSGKPMSCVCIVDESNIKAFSSDGEDFIASLQFKLRSVWSTCHGLLMERVIGPNEDGRLPTLFALLHPLDEITPVIVKQGSVNFMSDPAQHVVFCSDDPPIVMMYDSKNCYHSVWKMRKAHQEESQAMCGTESSLNLSSSVYLSSGNVSTSSNTGLHRSLFGNLSMNPGLSSPYNSNQSFSRPQSPIANMSKHQSPSRSPQQWINRSSRNFQSPSGPSSPVSFLSTPSPSAFSRLLTDNCAQDPRPVCPQICLEPVWTESSSSYGEGIKSGPAKLAFLTTDVVGQRYLCYLVPLRKQLLFSRLEKTNTSERLIFGMTAGVPAVDAAPITHLNMVLVVEPNGGIVLYSGTTVVGKVHLPGMPSHMNTSFLPINLFSQFGSPFPRRSSLLPSVRNFASHEPAVDPLDRIMSPAPIPRRSSLLPSFRNVNSLQEPFFDERAEMLSPVPHDKSRESPICSSAPISTQGTPRESLLALRDPVKNKVTLEYSNGNFYRMSLPEMCSSPLVSQCLCSLKQVLPRDVAVQLVVKWYVARNAPGTQDIAPSQEWRLFLGVLLGMLGYDVDKLAVMHQPSSENGDSPTLQPKKKRTCDSGSEEDWEYLLNSLHHHSLGPGLSSLLGLKTINGSSGSSNSDSSHGQINTNSLLFNYIPLVLLTLHLLYEDMKLNTLLQDSQPLLAQLLHQLASDLQYTQYAHHYWRDFPNHCLLTPVKESQIKDADLQKLSAPSYMPPEPPSIFEHLLLLMQGPSRPIPFPYLRYVNKRTRDIVQLISLLTVGLKEPTASLESFVRPIVPAGSRNDIQEISSLRSNKESSAAHRAVLLMVEMGFARRDLQTLPSAILLLLCDALYQARENPPRDWPHAAYKLIARQDLASQYEPTKVISKNTSKGSKCLGTLGGPTSARISQGSDLDDDMESLTMITKLRWPKDQRVAEARRLLQSSQPVSITIQQRPEVSDHEFIEEQERHLYALCTRTMALPVGRGMLTLRSSVPVITEPLPIPRLCLIGKVPPRGTTVDLSHIDVVPNMNMWPLFHNGVAAGLRIALSAPNIDSTWIVYNKPKGGSEVLTEHAGFLMALGLNGHLNTLAVLNKFEYLVKCHEMTSVGLLLGIAASKRGTMDVNATKMLSIHVEALLPPTSIELDVGPNTQVAALLGVGLVYQGTGHRRIAEVLLSEIGRPPGPEMENNVDRESYSLAAGLALGHVVLGQGSELCGLADLAIPDTLHYYMVGGHRRPVTGSQKEKYKCPSFHIREGESLNIDVTGPGATLALGMMYFKTGNRAVADWMKAPDTQYLLDFIRPDFLLLRMIARNLILWDEVLPTVEWVGGHVPYSIRPHCLVKPKVNATEFIDYETMNQAYCNIVAGACLSLGLRFAGSHNKEAFNTLLMYAKKFTSLLGKSISELAGKSTIETSLNVIVLSLAMVMAGSGSLEVMRICRFLRARVGPTNSVVTYGSHLATHMALGLLLMGGGRYTLSTSPPAIAAMLAAFFPKFPTHSNDNRYHLQAFRHLYVLAVEPRLLVPRDIDTGVVCYAHLTVVYLDSQHYSNQVAKLKAPCLLPELSTLKEVRIEDERYWTIVFHRDQNWDLLKRILEGPATVDVKQRAGCLSYSEDPHGFRSLLARTLTAQSVSAWSVPPESILAFSSDPTMVNFARLFLEEGSGDETQKMISAESERHLIQLLTALVYECITQDKRMVLSIWITTLKALQGMKRAPCPLLTWQLKLLVAQVLRQGRIGDKPVVTPDLALSVHQTVNKILESWEKDLQPLLKQYFINGKPSGNCDTLRKLATYLTYHRIPSPHHLGFLTEGHINPLIVSSHLHRLQLPMATIRKITAIMRSCKEDN
ncbi:Anaphase-promoting complex subunit 1 [Frankliniella fusca]|uniref:Anaphase-promoting complex subunit 1 n=1 Tax=Frankliniella fusca TaxID=407009 RepID=A0AAE1HLI1_9NEOP|nr:Anaphase-promoting complex subunit 1 [Frankliniella fusca]